MPTDIPTLQTLGDLDDKITRLRRGIARSLQKIRDAEQAVADAEGVESQAELDAAECRSRELGAQRKLDQYERQKRSAVRVLEQGLGSASVAQAQIEKNEELIDDIETVLLEVFDERDALVSALGQRKEETAAVREKLVGALEALPPKIEAQRAEQSELQGRQRAMLKNLYDEHQDVYLEMLRRKGAAVSWLEKKSCSRCRLLAPSNRLADLSRGLPIRCDGCARWLVPMP